jgi:hypothetical protein
LFGYNKFGVENDKKRVQVPALCTFHRLRTSVLVPDVCCICRFDKIIKKEIPSTVVYEDEKVLHNVFFIFSWIEKHFS